MSKFIYAAVFITILLPFTAFANGGDQRVVKNKYLINLSRAPFTPRADVKTSFLASFVDIQKNKLISEDLIVRVRISKLGEAPKGNFIFEQNNIVVKGGVLEFPYTFSEAALHEIFFDFAFASNPEKVYNAPDFLIDIQRPEPTEGRTSPYLLLALGGMAGLIAGVAAGRLFWGRSG